MHNSTNLHVKFEPPCVVHIIGNDCVSIHVQVALFEYGHTLRSHQLTVRTHSEIMNGGDKMKLSLL